MNHPLGLKTIIELYDKKDGNLIFTNERKRSQEAKIQVKINNPGQPEKLLEFPFRSYTSNFARLLENAFLNVDNSTSGAAIDKMILTTTGGATYAAAALHTGAVNEGALASPNQSVFGIWIGDKDNESGLALDVESGIGGTVDYNNYMLRAQILADGGSPDTDVVYKANNVLFSNSDNTLTISRRFQNNSAITVHVTEFGMVCKSGTDYFLIARDLCDYELVAGGTCEVQYIFTITDSSGWTKNYLRILSSMFVAGNAVSQVRDYTGAAQTVNFSSARTQKDLLAPVDVPAWGIILGDYPTVFNTATTSLFSGQPSNSTIDHSAVTAIALEQSENKTTFGLQRDFENVSTADQTFRSSGLMVRQGTDPYKYFLIAYDYLPAYNQSIVIAPNQVLRIKYLFEAPL